VDLVGELRAAFDEAGIALTHFEFVTVLALEWFAEIGVEAAVIEVGLGGRLDATNHVRPVVSVVTSIALDHEEFLGGDLTAIAAEKAGIVKADVPVCIGRLGADADAVVATTAAALDAPLLRFGVDATLERDRAGWTFRGPGTVWSGLEALSPAGWQREQQALALLALAAARDAWPVGEAAVRVGLAGLSWPGRLSVRPGPPPVVLDGGHNAAGIRALVAELPRLLDGRQARLVFACGRDRRWEEMVAALAPWAADVVVTEVGRRAAAAAALAAAFDARRVPVRIERDPRRAVEAALADAGDAPVLVTGSLFLVGDAYAVLGAEPLFEPWHGWGGGATESP
jgi:dihydrofolate synthase/folylpolyglutamate synthase